MTICHDVDIQPAFSYLHGIHLAQWRLCSSHAVLLSHQLSRRDSPTKRPLALIRVVVLFAAVECANLTPT